MTKKVAARAAALVGTRFRPQGRSTALGLDCIGVIATAHEIDLADVPSDYRLRGTHAETMLTCAMRWFRRIPPRQARAGDVLIMVPAVDQLHLGIRTSSGFVHADARLGKVVETPGWPGWPVTTVLRRRSRRSRSAR